MTKEFTDENFQVEVMEASKEKPVLIDFFAAWCGPCKIQGPMVDEVAQAMGDKAVVGKLDTETSHQTASKFGVMSIPNLIIIKDGKVVENFVGLQPKESLIATLEKYL
ncbi:thioredoxin [Candidatus Falkowbacteria bacterium]|nr:MAG: thioredoxin [Candidatus Falkowbacteria bacterium]